MRAILLIAIAIIFLFTLTAQVEGADWKEVYENDKAIFFLNVSKITKLPNNHYKAWEKLTFKDPTSKLRKSILYKEYDCDNKRRRYLQVSLFDKNGGAKTNSEIRPWQYVVPDSPDELMLTLVCNNYKGNWEKIISVGDENKSEYYIDWSSMKKLPNNHYMIWDKIVNTDPSSEPDFWITYSEYDCVKKRVRTPVLVVYKRSGLAQITSFEWKASGIVLIVCIEISKGK